MAKAKNMEIKKSDGHDDARQSISWSGFSEEKKAYLERKWKKIDSPEYKKAMAELKESLKRKHASGGFKEYYEDYENCFDGWHYWEPQYLEYPERLKLDNEAYLSYYNNPDFNMEIEANDPRIINRLIKNLEKAKSLYFIGYREYLMKIFTNENKEEGEAITAPELKSTVDKYVLLHELGIIDLLNNKPNYQKLSDTKKAMMLGLILGTDKIEMLRTCIIYTGNSNKGILHSKNPLKSNNVANVRGLLLSQIGIDTTDKV